jgi:hypothetical protein
MVFLLKYSACRGFQGQELVSELRVFPDKQAIEAGRRPFEPAAKGAAS